MTKKKYILLFGRTGSGKSALGNVLTGTNKFKESQYSVSQTKKIQVESFEVEGEDITYYVVDVIGIGDTNLTVETVLFKLAEVAKLVKDDGINQVFFVTRGKFTKAEVDAYRILSEVIFDEEVYDYTTIIRTDFPYFRDKEKCREDVQLLKNQNQDAFPVVSKISKDGVVHVNNTPLEEGETSNNNRRDSRAKLLVHLAGVKDKVYRPKGVDDIDKRIRTYVDEEKSAEKQIKALKDELAKIKKDREADSQKITELDKELKKIDDDTKKKIKELTELQSSSQRQVSEWKAEIESKTRMIEEKAWMDKEKIKWRIREVKGDLHDEKKARKRGDHKIDRKVDDVEAELKKAEKRLEQVQHDLKEAMKDHIVQKMAPAPDLTHDPDKIVRYSAVGVKLGSKTHLPVIAPIAGGLIGVGVGVVSKFVDILRGK